MRRHKLNFGCCEMVKDKWIGGYFIDFLRWSRAGGGRMYVQATAGTLMIKVSKRGHSRRLREYYSLAALKCLSKFQRYAR